MSTKPYYVILTGSKNNAGDFLIKYRAKQIFEKERPDIVIVDMDAWNKFDDETLELVNKSECLILMGGPALQKNLYPGIYPLVDDLSKITTKITMIGVGWKSLNGSWSDTENYQLTYKTKQLLSRIENDKIGFSVRDYHTMNVLNCHGYSNVHMTGCPATYCHRFFNTELKQNEIKKVAFSLGVSFISSKEMELQMKETIIGFKKYFESINSNIEVVFHHSTKNDFLKTHGSFPKHLESHLNFIKWLEKENLSWIDISGSADNLINYYNNVDLHIGYRVHAHIFMCSISKPSVLISEDGRGRALEKVINGCIIDSFSYVGDSNFHKLFRKLGVHSGFYGVENKKNEIISTVLYELKHEFPRMKSVRHTINNNYQVMLNFIKKLP